MEIRLGEISQKTKVVVGKDFNPEKKVKSIKPSCGCMTVKYDDTTNRIILTFKAGEVPQHVMQRQGYQSINLYLTVFYMDNTSERISVTGKVV